VDGVKVSEKTIIWRKQLALLLLLVLLLLLLIIITPWPESASKLYQPSDRRLSAKLVPTFVNRGCHVVSVTDPYAVYSVF
jgi:hypothetical protein